MNNFPIHGPLDGQMGGGQVVGGQMDKARDKCKQLRDIFGNIFYLEVQDHGLDFDKTINDAMI